MKNAIVQVFIPSNHNHLNWQNDEVLMLSMALVKEYAKRIGADYYLIDTAKLNMGHPTWERFQLLEDHWWDKYEQILYLDTDVFPWLETPNIFDEFKTDAFNVVVHCKDNDPMSFNAGVLGFNKYTAENFSKHFDKDECARKFAESNYHDNNELSRLSKLVNTNRIDPKWNMKNSPNGYITHMWGGAKKKNPNHPSIIKARNQVRSLK